MKTLGALLLTDDTKIRKNRNLNDASARKLERLACSLHRGEKTSLGFMTGIGISSKGFPLRLPAIAIPTLRIMDRLDVLGVHDYHYTLYQARDFLAKSQEMSQTEAIEISNRMERYLLDYIRANYPHHEENIDFEFDKKIDPELLEKVKYVLRTSNSPDMTKITAYAMSKGKDAESAYDYAAANVVCNISERAENIVIGGEKERPFFRLGQFCESQIGANESIFLVQSTGHIPPYYPQSSEEPYIDATGKLVTGSTSISNTHIAYDQSIL